MAAVPLLVSVIVPVFDGARFLAAALRSIQAQDYQPFETIVVDDGSRDGTPEIAEAHPGVRCLRRLHAGVAAARNAGLAAARGAFVAWLDADDRWTADKLRVQMAHHLAHPEHDWSVAHQRLFLEAGQARPSWLPPHLLENAHVGFFPSTLVARREAYDRVGGYATGYEPAESADWFARASDAGLRGAVLPEVLLEKRVHAGNLGHAVATTRRHMLALLRDSIGRKRALRRDEPT